MRNLWLWTYIVLYFAFLFVLYRQEGMDPTEPLFIFFVLGVGFSLLALLFTRDVPPLATPVHDPAQEFVFLVAWLIGLATYLVVGRPYLDAVTAQPLHAIVIAAAKLLLFVAAPALALIFWRGYSVRDLAPVSLGWRQLRPALWMSAVILIFQAVFGRGLRDIAAAHLPATTLALAVPLTVIWLALEVGIVEEFFFRALLQTRAARLVGSEIAGIVIASALFGLLHAPGLYLRTAGTQEALSANPSLVSAIGYSFVITSVAGFFLGTLWARTRNFAVVVLVHAAADLLPNLAPTIKAWHG